MSSADKEVVEDLTIPRAAINRLIKESLPDIRVANESRQLILHCCSELIHCITTEANTICESQQKKTMTAKHVLSALKRLGFSAYISETESVVNDWKLRRRPQTTRLEHLGIPEEELLRQQQALFAKAREEQAVVEQQEWIQMQNIAIGQHKSCSTNEDEEY